MPTNKNALLRYQILDRCFSDFHRKYFIEDLMNFYLSFLLCRQMDRKYGQRIA